MALVFGDGGRACISTAEGILFPSGNSVGVRVQALVTAHPRYPAAAVFLRDMSEGDRARHAWARDPLASWHFENHGTGFTSLVERAEGLRKWFVAHEKRHAAI